MIAPTMEKKTASVFPATFPGAPVIYLNTYSNEGQKVYETAQAVGCPTFSLVTISNLDWNHGPVEQPSGVQERGALYRRGG